MYTQKQLLTEFIKEYGSATPAKLCGTFYKGQIFGSDIPRRARNLREDGKLQSNRLGKFEIFFLGGTTDEVIHTILSYCSKEEDCYGRKTFKICSCPRDFEKINKQGILL